MHTVCRTGILGGFNLQSSIFNFQSSIFNLQFSIFNFQSSIFNLQFSILLLLFHDAKLHLVFPDDGGDFHIGFVGFFHFDRCVDIHPFEDGNGV